MILLSKYWWSILQIKFQILVKMLFEWGMIKLKAYKMFRQLCFSSQFWVGFVDDTQFGGKRWSVTLRFPLSASSYGLGSSVELWDAQLGFKNCCWTDNVCVSGWLWRWLSVFGDMTNWSYLSVIHWVSLIRHLSLGRTSAQRDWFLLFILNLSDILLFWSVYSGIRGSVLSTFVGLVVSWFQYSGVRQL